MDTKVEITFLFERSYDDSFFKPFDKLILSLSDAIELVNSDWAVITKIFE